jgi:hypothetical protein
MVMIRSEAEFWSHVEICAHGRACRWCCHPFRSWPQHGRAKDNPLYQYVSLPDGSHWGAHRLAKMLSCGAGLLPGIFVCHHCDYPACCNDAHLFLGTLQDNLRDYWQKVRRGNYSPYPWRRRKRKERLQERSL